MELIVLRLFWRFFKLIGDSFKFQLKNVSFSENICGGKFQFSLKTQIYLKKKKAISLRTDNK